MNRVILVFVSVLAGLFLRDLYGQVSTAAQGPDVVTQGEAAQAFWNSDEYAPLRRARIDGEWGDFDVYLFPGLPE